VQLTKPVFDMLDRVSTIGSQDLADAQALVNNVSSTVQKMSDSIEAATVDRVDQFQTSYLGKAANGSAQADSGTDRLVKAVHAVYYVSSWVLTVPYAYISYGSGGSASAACCCTCC
jgi:hypothetical protein